MLDGFMQNQDNLGNRNEGKWDNLGTRTRREKALRATGRSRGGAWKGSCRHGTKVVVAVLFSIIYVIYYCLFNYYYYWGWLEGKGCGAGSGGGSAFHIPTREMKTT